MACSRRQKHRRRQPGDDQDQSKFHNYKNYAYEIKQNISKNIFLLLGLRRYDGIAHCFFSYYHSQRLLFSPTKNNFSTTLIPLKNRDINIEGFCRFYL